MESPCHTGLVRLTLLVSDLPGRGICLGGGEAQRSVEAEATEEVGRTEVLHDGQPPRSDRGGESHGQADHVRKITLLINSNKNIRSDRKRVLFPCRWVALSSVYSVREHGVDNNQKNVVGRGILFKCGDLNLLLVVSTGIMII
jgi:hypothetical protein